MLLNEHYSLVAPAYTSSLTTHILHIVSQWTLFISRTCVHIHPHNTHYTYYSTSLWMSTSTSLYAWVPVFYIYSLLDNNMLSFPPPFSLWLFHKFPPRMSPYFISLRCARLHARLYYHQASATSVLNLQSVLLTLYSTCDCIVYPWYSTHH